MFIYNYSLMMLLFFPRLGYRKMVYRYSLTGEVAIILVLDYFRVQIPDVFPELNASFCYARVLSSI